MRSLLESLHDLLQPTLAIDLDLLKLLVVGVVSAEVQALWHSFDGDWRRPPLLEQARDSVANEH